MQYARTDKGAFLRNRFLFYYFFMLSDVDRDTDREHKRINNYLNGRFSACFCFFYHINSRTSPKILCSNELWHISSLEQKQ
jgi:hypothetical protein